MILCRVGPLIITETASDSKYIAIRQGPPAKLAEQQQQIDKLIRSHRHSIFEFF